MLDKSLNPYGYNFCYSVSQNENFVRCGLSDTACVVVDDGPTTFGSYHDKEQELSYYIVEDAASEEGRSNKRGDKLVHMMLIRGVEIEVNYT